MWHDWKVFSAGWPQFLGVHLTDDSSQISAANLCGEDPKLKPQREGNVRLFIVLVDIKERAKVSGCHVDGNKKTIREMLISGWKYMTRFAKEKFKENFDLFEIKDKLKVCHLGFSVWSHPFMMLGKKHLFRRTDANISKY